MNTNEIVLRQQRLRMRSAQLRLTLESQTHVFQTPLAAVDQVRSGLQWLYRNPEWPMGALLALVVIRPRRTIIWGRRLWWTWRTFRKVRNWIMSMPYNEL